MSSTQTIESAFQEAGNSLIRYVEVWTPNDEGTRLELSAVRTAGASAARKSASPEVTEVQPGEGIAGAAWNQKAATIFQEEPNDLLKKMSDTCGTDLAAVVAIPIFQQQDIRGVVVLGFSGAHGAAEIWSRDDRDELAVTSGHYAGLPSFEFITRHTRFPKGAGLPGSVWKDGSPQIAQNLDTSSSFIRSFGTDPASISAAIGIPISNTRGFPSSVLLLLGAEDTPLSGRTELWSCEDPPSEQDSELSMPQIKSCVTIGHAEAQSFEQWQHAVMEIVAEEKLPVLTDSTSKTLPTGASFNVAIPVFKASRVAAVLNFMF